MTFYSLPFTPERMQATESRLESIYEAARYGLKGDSLAMAAGMTPRQFRVFNVSNNEVLELRASFEQLNFIVVSLLQGKYRENVAKTDDEFLLSNVIV